MISIIICSRLSQISSLLYNNINETVGCDYELIVIDNSNRKYSIFEAYNIGIQKSKSEILCFVHDDILFHTKGWGLLIQSEFYQNSDFDLIGIAGSKVKTQFPVGWWDCHDNSKVINIIQHEKNTVKNQNIGFINDSLLEVSIVDGVFMCLRNENYLFDNRIHGFHNYDINLSCEVKSRGRKVGVTNKVLLEHFSLGKLDREWFTISILFHKYYYNRLVENKFTNEEEVFSGKRYIDYFVSIYGRKKVIQCVSSLFYFSTSIKIRIILLRYLLIKLKKT